MKIQFKNEFMVIHFIFITLYMTTFIVGWLRGTHAFFYQIHPIIGIASFIVPLLYFVTSKKKKLIIQMIKGNFNYKGRPVMKVAKASTQVIAVYYVFSVITGFLLNNGLYGSTNMYLILERIHGVSKLIVPLAVLSHVVSRLMMKKARSSRTGV